MQALAGTVSYLFLSENVQQDPDFFGQTAAFLCRSCHNLLGLVMAVLC
jgi:hypothetical protein